MTVAAVTRNHECWAKEALASLDRQLWGELQVVVVDDASTDRTPQMVRAWIDRTTLPVTFIQHDRQHGICHSLNEVLALAQGEFFLHLALDDVWLPHRVSHHMEVFTTVGDDVAVVFSDVVPVDPRGRQISPNLLRGDLREFERQGRSIPSGSIFPDLARVNSVAAPGATIRMSALRSVGPYDERLVFEDWDMWLRLSSRYKFHFCDPPGALYRVHPDSMFQSMGSGPAYAESSFLLLHKQLGVDPRADEVIRRSLYFYGRRLYSAGHPGAARFLRSAAWADPRPRAIYRALTASFGLSAQMSDRVADGLRAVADRFDRNACRPG